MEARSRRPGTDSVGTTKIETDCSATFSDCATPHRYVSETELGKDSISTDNSTVKSKVAMQFEHLLHGSAASCLVNPAIQAHFMSGMTPSEFSGQSRHVLGVEAPTAVEYVPAAQGVHVPEAEAPRAVEYVPIPQF